MMNLQVNILWKRTDFDCVLLSTATCIFKLHGILTQEASKNRTLIKKLKRVKKSEEAKVVNRFRLE